MAMVREPILTTVAIVDLRPTQITVGMREVMAKRKRWRETGFKKGEQFLGKHMIPVILGPKNRHYVIDHHHLARALHDEGQNDVAVTVIANLSKLERDTFWVVMDNRSWMHPFDAKGERRHYGDIPKSVADLVDDPFRSLAGELRRAGGFAKDTTPFSEFLWADFLRRRIKRKMVERDFDRAMEKAISLAKSPDADYLPGWCGPVPEG
ncbi:MAG TPA: ParB-like protein [Xanthobacteraceae bacterium]|nr:ParB-like protein [Xanthobacteraceae bacterium]